MAAMMDWAELASHEMSFHPPQTSMQYACEATIWAPVNVQVNQRSLN